MIELGISTFGETTPLNISGQTIGHAERIRQLVAEIELADQVGLDIYAIGEHHRPDFAVSAPEIILAAGAVRTQQIKLSSAVTVLSSQDPVRVFQQFASIDALSSGRAEVMVGRGSFTESFPLFGYDLADYEALFEEKLEMLLAIDQEEVLDWQGDLTQSIHQTGIYPRPANGHLPIWAATGGNPQSTLRIAQQGLPIAYAIIGGNPMAFKSLIDLYRQAGYQAGYSQKQLQVAAHSWGFIGPNHEQAIADYFHPTKQTVDAIAKDRPSWRPMDQAAYLSMVGPDGAMLVGDPEHVAHKLINLIEGLGLDRFLLHLPIGSMPHQAVMTAIELYGKEVAPRVRAHFSANKKALHQ